MNKGKISASMMCSNLVDLKKTIEIFEKEKIEYLHIDMMDGDFVPNFGLGVDYIRSLRELTSFYMLMIIKSMLRIEETYYGDMKRYHFLLPQTIKS